MVLTLLYLIIRVIYLLLPIAALGAAIFGWKRWRALPGAVIVSFVAGLGVSIALNLVYIAAEPRRGHDSFNLFSSTALRGHLSAAQVLLGAYVASTMFLLLRLLDHGLLWTARRAFALHRENVETLRRTRIFFAMLLRVCLLFAVGLPYVMASVMIYRPKILPLDDPRSQLGFDFQRVEFVTSDGIKIAGWWIPAQQPARRSRYDSKNEQWGDQTALICHGLASNKSNQLILARRLVPGGFNCLAFDFRAHGQSGGQITSFGATEKRDVLAAVRWLQENHPQQAQRIVGVGASMGAAALISAAADDSPEGRAISAVAGYACYDDLYAMTRSTAKNYFAPPLDWLLLHVGLPIAAAQTGSDLIHYTPAHDVAALWPRPLLLIHGQRDEIIDFARGQSLLDAASQPKYHVWYPAGTHNDILNDETAARIVLEFFRTATSQPVI